MSTNIMPRDTFKFPSHCVSGAQDLYREDAARAVHAEAALPPQVHTRAGHGHRHVLEGVLVVVSLLRVRNGREGTEDNWDFFLCSRNTPQLFARLFHRPKRIAQAKD